MTSRQITWRIAGAGVLGLCMWAALSPAQQSLQSVDALTTVKAMTQVMGRPTDHSVALSVLGPDALEAYAEYGVKPGVYTGKTAVAKSGPRTPFELTMDKLTANTHYYYRLQYRQPGAAAFTPAAEYGFQTQRPAGSTYVFAVQADSHPERLQKMFDPELYARTMAEVSKEKADFFITLGDDFSIDTGNMASAPEKVAQVYINQRNFLGMGGVSMPVFLVNGNHEQAAMYLLNGTPNNPAVWAGNSRNRYYPNPAPDSFYTGDAEPVEHIGLLRDYYAFTWGDALFISIDPYWHSKVPVDNVLANNGAKRADLWDITHGEAQYRWLQKTLSESKAKYKFIFAHHVLGTGRGAVEIADGYEWGGKGKTGEWEFDKRRPGWEMPIHQMMVKYGVSIFFQGHDHLFVHQQKDGVVYQETPTPADPNYDNPNAAAYKTGEHYNAAGHIRVTISPQNAKVDYIRSWLPKDEVDGHKQGEVAFSYNVKPGK